MRYPRTTKVPKIPSGEWLDLQLSVRRTIEVILMLAQRKSARSRKQARRMLIELEETIRQPIPKEIWDKI
jgi:hypothetical protein